MIWRWIIWKIIPLPVPNWASAEAQFIPNFSLSTKFCHCHCRDIKRKEGARQFFNFFPNYPPPDHNLGQILNSDLASSYFPLEYFKYSTQSSNLFSNILNITNIQLEIKFSFRSQRGKCFSGCRRQWAHSIKIPQVNSVNPQTPLNTLNLFAFVQL